jgi:hypothetical protein
LTSVESPSADFVGVASRSVTAHFPPAPTGFFPVDEVGWWPSSAHTGSAARAAAPGRQSRVNRAARWRRLGSTQIQPPVLQRDLPAGATISVDFRTIHFWVIFAVAWWAATWLVPAIMCMREGGRRLAVTGFIISWILGTAIILWFWAVFMQGRTASI